MNLRPIAAASLFVASLAGCVSQGTYPSLALRPAEQEEATADGEGTGDTRRSQPLLILPAFAGDH